MYSTLFKHKADHGGLPSTVLTRENKISEVYVWGSNSSFQLGETGLDRIMLPKLATSFSDVDLVRDKNSQITYRADQAYSSHCVLFKGGSWSVLYI